MIERYLYAIEKYLPKKSRKDIINELRSLIYDEVEARKDATALSEDAIIKAVLIELGRPQHVAASYLNTGEFINKSLEPLFWMIVKIVAIVVPIALFFVQTLSYFNSHLIYKFSEYLLFILESVPSMITSVFTSFGVITLIFYGISRYDAATLEAEMALDPFDPEKLPKIPDSVYKISLIERLAALIFSLGLLYILNYQQGVIAVYSGGERYPLLNDTFDTLLLFINIGIITQMIIAIIDLIYQRKTLATKTATYIQTLYSAVILLVLAFTDSFNEIVINTYDLSIVFTIFTVVLVFAAIASIIGGTVDFIKVFLQTDTNKK
jgi:hypothetical protein